MRLTGSELTTLSLSDLLEMRANNESVQQLNGILWNKSLWNFLTIITRK
jgi:hypothetical protein